MTTLVIVRGIQGSGKTTWAKSWVDENPGKRKRVNRDSLREMVNDYQAYEESETAIIRARDALIKTFLTMGLDVVCDDTNLPSRTVRDLMKLAALCKAEVEIKDLTNVPLEVCIQRDIDRRQYRYHKWCIGAEIITATYNKYVKGKGYPLPVPTLDGDDTKIDVIPVTYVEGLEAAYMVDIDGTIAQMTNRSPFDWTRVHEDVPVEDVIWTVRELAKEHHIVFCSGRSSVCREATEEWINKHVFNYSQRYTWDLHMRPAGDNRKDNIVKLELFDKYIRNRYNVIAVLDDRQQVVDAWRSIGLTVFQVAEGNF